MSNFVNTSNESSSCYFAFIIFFTKAFVWFVQTKTNASRALIKISHFFIFASNSGRICVASLFVSRANFVRMRKKKVAWRCRLVLTPSSKVNSIDNNQHQSANLFYRSIDRLWNCAAKQKHRWLWSKNINAWILSVHGHVQPSAQIRKLERVMKMNFVWSLYEREKKDYDDYGSFVWKVVNMRIMCNWVFAIRLTMHCRDCVATLIAHGFKLLFGLTGKGTKRSNLYRR